jgi:signal transduction histidine kinase
MMNQKLRILHLEDDEFDAALIRAKLEASNISCDITRVQTREGFGEALCKGTYDLILADYILPMYDGISALQLVRENGLDVPFIFTSGVMGEDAAINALTRGATDYVPKQKLSRLVPAVIRAIHEMEIERERKQAAEALRESEKHLKTVNANLENTIHELAAANKELESFSYSVAHDLRNPLKVISGFADFLIEDYAERLDEEGKNYLYKIKSGTERMNSIIDDILALSKISRQEMEIVDLDLSEMAQLSINELSGANPDRKVEINIQKGLKARADARLMSVTLGNLLGNAWKYTGKTEHPKIEFGSFEKDGQIVYYVKDNGVGFDMRQANKLFAPFQRCHSEKEFKGTGIGLAIVERAIKRHGGNVWTEGEVDNGAIFYFTLEQ